MKLVSGRNRRNREIRKLLVSLALHVVIIKAKKTRSQLHSALTTCFHCTKHITPVTTRARLKIQTPIALIIPSRSSRRVVWPWPPHSQQARHRCVPPSVSAAAAQPALSQGAAAPLRASSCSDPV